MCVPVVSVLCLLLGLVVPLTWAGAEAFFSKQFWANYGTLFIQFSAMVIPFVSGLVILHSWWEWKKENHE